jgi:hypothetical protein
MYNRIGHHEQKTLSQACTFQGSPLALTLMILHGAEGLNCRLFKNSVPSADACLTRGSATANRPPRKTTQTTLSHFTSPRAKLGPPSKSLPSTSSKERTSPQAPVYNRSVSLPATVPLNPWKDASLRPGGSPGAKRRKRTESGDALAASNGREGVSFEGGSSGGCSKGAHLQRALNQGHGGTTDGKGSEGSCGGMDPEGDSLPHQGAHEALEPGQVGCGEREVSGLDWRISPLPPQGDPSKGNKSLEIGSEERELRGQESEIAAAKCRGLIPFPEAPLGGQKQLVQADCSTVALVPVPSEERCTSTERLGYLDTWAVGQRYREAAGECTLGAPVRLVREAENPKDANAILVICTGSARAAHDLELFQEQEDVVSERQREKGGEAQRGAGFGRPVKRPPPGMGSREEISGESQGDAAKAGFGKSSGQKPSVVSLDEKTPRKQEGQSRPGDDSDRPISDTSEFGKLDRSEEAGTAGEKKRTGVSTASVIGHLPAVVAAHLAPLMDRYGADLEGAVTVLPQCIGASVGIQIRVPLELRGCRVGSFEGEEPSSVEAARRKRDSRGGRERGKEKGGGGIATRTGCTRMETQLAVDGKWEGERDQEGTVEAGAGEEKVKRENVLLRSGASKTVTEVSGGESTEAEKADGNAEAQEKDPALFRLLWRTACEAAAKARASLVADPTLPKYQGNFLYILRTALDADGHLYSDEETELLRGIGRLSGDGQRLIVRLFQRKGKGPVIVVSNLHHLTCCTECMKLAK